MTIQKYADVVIIGGGVIGCAIAFELAKYDLVISLIEKEPDVSFGASSANTGLIHAGFDPNPGSLKARFNVEGNKIFPSLTSELNIPFKQIGALVIACSDSELSSLDRLKKRGELNSIDNLKILDKKEVHDIEPMISDNICGALYAPSAGIISPYELTIALAENAVINGVQIELSTRVIDITIKQNSVQKVITDHGQIDTKYVINSAGLFADEIGRMVGLKTFSIHPRRGEYLLLDKRLAGSVKHTLFPVPSKISKGIVVTPTVDGNILIGPNAENIEDKTDTVTTLNGQTNIIKKAQQLVPGLRYEDVITRFAGLRAVPNSDDFIIDATKINGFINIAGIASPGLTSAPAIAKHVVSILENEEGKKLNVKPDYQVGRPEPLRTQYLEPEKHHKKIQQNVSYGHIVCRCEHVTEGEVYDALHQILPVTTVKGVRYRTRIGMGRCQGGFCLQKLIFLLSETLSQPVEKITLDGKGSEFLKKTKKGFRSRRNKYRTNKLNS
jgi:glycerol-3-phosphate dehydrogenase